MQITDILEEAEQADARPGGLEGLGGLAAMLDRDGNGNPLDDILRKVGGLLR